MESLVPAPATGDWYGTRYQCLRTDPTLIARNHTFPDAVIPRGLPEDPAAASKVCMSYRNGRPAYAVDATSMIEVEAAHPQFAFRVGAPVTPYQIDVESQLRRLDQPLGNCQAVLAADAPLYRNTVAPPMPTQVPAHVQNAANPIAAIIREEAGCRSAADQVATALSGRWINNPTRYDTMTMAQPFGPPGIGSA